MYIFAEVTIIFSVEGRVTGFVFCIRCSLFAVRKRMGELDVEAMRLSVESMTSRWNRDRIDCVMLEDDTSQMVLRK